MGLRELNIDGLINNGALSSAVAEADSRKIRQLAPHKILSESAPPEFLFLIDNGQREAPMTIVEVQIEVGDITFRGKFSVMKNLTRPLIVLRFLQHSITKLGNCPGKLNFPFFLDATQKCRQNILQRNQADT